MYCGFGIKEAVGVLFQFGQREHELNIKQIQTGNLTSVVQCYGSMFIPIYFKFSLIEIVGFIRKTLNFIWRFFI